MRIKGKLCLKELKLFMIALGVAMMAGLAVYGFFALLSVCSWVLAWVAIGAVLTPVAFWILQYLHEDIVIDDTHETEESSIELHDSYW